MAKAGKLTKLRSALKKMNSFGKLRRENSVNCTPAPSDECHVSNHNNIGLHTVYVGKSLRRYQVTSEVLDHPLIKELVDKSDGCDDHTTVIGCEVVLFEHLLWMLQNIDSQSESLEDLVGFYAY
ncbi:auxin-responsive protein SAUR78 [Beta vulgaris subsp. vulgaris]|uniref:auxin-responsive protein SAUR78 n=1 Tax=Beta vulgaris subsp. vulgaris TaxID=3555 RepID=UPI00254980EB|nr:auxin-responsive protein SAUR78 [Beta vulgaris subsp. vulgaris]